MYVVFGLIVFASAGFAFLMLNVFVWKFGAWQDVYRCDSCKVAAPWPWMTAYKPCPDCGEKSISQHVARWRFGWQYKSTRPANDA